MQIGTRIQTLLTEQDIPQCKLAYDLHLNPNTVNGYIKNRRLPDCFTLSKIAQYLGTNVDYLLGNTNIKVHPHLTLQEDETQILNQYRSLNKEQQHMFKELTAALYAYCSAEKKDSSPSLH